VPPPPLLISILPFFNLAANHLSRFPIWFWLTSLSLSLLHPNHHLPHPNHHFKLNPLDSRNYATWPIRMQIAQIALAENKCKSLVLGTESSQFSRQPKQEQHSRRGKRNGSNETSSPSTGFRWPSRTGNSCVAACANVKDPWDILKTAHRVDGASGKMMVQRKLRYLRMEEGLSAQSYIEQFEDIVAEATILDRDIIKTPEQLALLKFDCLVLSLRTSSLRGQPFA